METDQLFEAIVSTQARQDSGSSRTNEDVIGEIAEDMLSRLPPPSFFNISTIQEKYPVNYSESMNTVLVQELIRFQTLVETIRDSLQQLQKAMKGLVVLSTELENVGMNMLVNRIPSLWASKSYPSMKPLGSYFTDLLARLSFFRKWIDEGQPIVYWVSGFYFTQSFLTGVLQNYARKHKIPIDLLAFDFIVQTRQLPSERPADGVYINGLFLEGARWNDEEYTISESLPKVLYDPLPVIWFKPAKKAEIKPGRVYDCPVYKTGARRGTLSTTGHSTNYVMSLQLPTKVEEERWINRGVASLCGLND